MHFFQKKISLLFFLSLYISSAFCQEYNYSHYDVKDGLAGSTVYSIAQDKDGFIWYGTETGLSRFDGTHFKNFYTSDGLPDNEIIQLFVDSKNRVWIIPFKNSICYYWKGKIYNQENDSLLRKLNITAELISVIEDSAGNLLIVQKHGIYLIDTARKISAIDKINGAHFTIIKAGLSKSGKFQIALIVNGVGPFGLTELTANTLSLVRNLNPFRANSFFSIELSPNFEILRDGDWLHLKNTDRDSEIVMPLPENLISLSRINKSFITINTIDGTRLFDIDKMKVTDTFLRHQTINFVAKDSEDNLWFSVPGKGVYRLSSGRFFNFLSAPQNKPVFCIQKIDSILYAGLDSYYLLLLNINEKGIALHKISNTASRGRITALVKTDKNNIIAGTDNGLFRLKYDGTGIIKFRFDCAAVKSITSLSDDKIIVSTSNGVFDTRTINFEYNDTIWRDRSTCSFSANGKLFYIGTLNGMYIVDNNKKITYAGDSNPIFKNRINAIGQSNDGLIWIATNGAGLVACKNNKIEFIIDENKGLTSNICRSVFISSQCVWVGTDKGLNKITYRGDSSQIITYTNADGLSSEIINAIYNEGNDVYVGTPEGLTYFNETQITKKSICNLRITSINTSENKFFSDTSGFLLPHPDNNINFQFVGISYKSGGKINYQYRLIGLDTLWRTTRETSLAYQSLPSGKYELQLIAINKFGVQSNTAHISFTIAKTLWEKTWFRVLLIITFVILLWLLISYRIGLIERREQNKSQTISKIAELEQMALKSQMNPHFIFNCLNSIQHYVMDKDILGANEFISKFSRLIRITLDNSSKAEISIADEIEYITLYMELEQKRFEDKFTFQIISDGIAKHNYFIPPMILQPYIENAIRHGVRYRDDDKGKIIVTFENDNGYLVCSVADNGIGRKLSYQYKSKNPIGNQSKGMELTAKRIEMFNQSHISKTSIKINDLEDDLNKPLGTEVIIYFPLEEKK
jgi:ligand-binding sensor domain-containing protein